MVLFFEHKQRYNEFILLKPTLERYNVKITDEMLTMALGSWKEKEWVKVTRSEQGLAAKIMPSKAADVYKTVLHYLGATTLTINAHLMEVCSDSDPTDDTPMVMGWKWLTYEKDEQREHKQPESAQPLSPVIHNNITVSPVINNAVSIPNPDNGPSTSATLAAWFGGFGQWIAAAIGAGALYVAYLAFLKD